MRTMPIVTENGVIPSLSAAKWWRRLEQICGTIKGRPLTAQEKQRADKMANHNWTLRIVADDLFGEANVSPLFLPS